MINALIFLNTILLTPAQAYLDPGTESTGYVVFGTDYYDSVFLHSILILYSILSASSIEKFLYNFILLKLSLVCKKDV